MPKGNKRGKGKKEKEGKSQKVSQLPSVANVNNGESESLERRDHDRN